MRVVAIDWSGARRRAARRIWLAEVTDGRLTRLERDRGRAEVAEYLIELARDDGDLVVGLDFAFAFPAWFARRQGATSARELWNVVARDGESWLSGCEAPFWGRPGRARPACEEPLRRTERDVPRVAGIAPKSVFQIGGAGAVGTGSLRGMPVLGALQDAGFSIWPFDAPRLPLVVEIYPRLLTEAVLKSDPAARRDYLLSKFAGLDPSVVDRGASTEDAFDALVSALVMWRHRDQLLSLAEEMDADVRLEGRIWVPDSLASRGGP